jgi:uncharacterized protein YkwD
MHGTCRGAHDRKGRIFMRRVLTIALLAASLLLSQVAQVALAATLPVNHAQFVTRVIELVNAERQRAGLSPLVANGPLTRAAQDYAGVLGDGSCFAHDCGGTTLAQRIDRAGYVNWTVAGENIALGQSTPEDVMAAWMNSSGHRANILNASYKDIGVGLAVRASGQIAWVQEFGASRTVASTPPPANCSTRPTFSVRSRQSAPGVLEVTVVAGTSAGAPSNTLRAVKFGAVLNGTVDVTGYGHVNPGTTVGIIPGTQQVVFVVHRPARAGTTIPLVLTDACGDWRTFVGAGANAW